MTRTLINRAIPYHRNDPRILRKGPGSLGTADRTARALGWFSIALGLAELFAPRQLGRSLGLPGIAPLLRACGLREIGSGVATLSTDPRIGLWSRVAGDALDLAILGRGLRRRRSKHDAIVGAMAVVGAIMVLDSCTAVAVHRRHRRGSGPLRDYSDRSGFRTSPDRMRGAAAGFVDRHAAGLRTGTPPRGNGGAADGVPAH